MLTQTVQAHKAIKLSWGFHPHSASLRTHFGFTDMPLHRVTLTSLTCALLTLPPHRIEIETFKHLKQTKKMCQLSVTQ